MPELSLPEEDGFLKKENGQIVIGTSTPGGGVELGETNTTAYRGDRGKTAYDHSQSSHAPVDAVAQANTYTDDEVSALASATTTALSGKEPANANIQNHISSSHAPSNAQKNSDITKAEIEAKLTGELTSHTHPVTDPFTKLRLGSNIATGANVTPVNLTGMSFNYVAGGVYTIDIYATVQAAAATTGHGFGVNCTTAPVLVSIGGSCQLANTGTGSNWSSIANNAIAGVTSGIPGATTNVPSIGGGTIVMNATTGGTCQFIFRSETTAVTTCIANTVITVLKVN